MAANVRISIDSADQILLKRHLSKNGEGQRFFTHEVRRLSDPYVPMQSGTMKNSAIEQTDRITYPQVYSKRQYYNNKGNGLRGREWDRRMWADRGPEIVKATANFCGGRAE